MCNLSQGLIDRTKVELIINLMEADDLTAAQAIEKLIKELVEREKYINMVKERLGM